MAHSARGKQSLRAIPSQGLRTAYRSEQAAEIDFELWKKSSGTPDVVAPSHFFDLAGPLRYVWNTQVTKLSLQGVGSCLYGFRHPLCYGETQGCQVFGSL